MPARFDVVIPAHNAAATLARAIESALAAEPDGQVIVFCDSCADNSADIAARLGVTVLTGEAGTAGGARNAGAAEARAEFIAFLDADDEYLPHWLTTVKTSVEADPAPVLLYSAHRRIDDRGQQLVEGAGPSGDIRVPLLGQLKIPTSAMVVRRDAFSAVGGFDPTLYAAEDFDLALRLCERGPARCVEGEYIIMHSHWPSLTRGDEVGLLRYRDANLEVLSRRADHKTLGPHVERAITEALVDSAVRFLAAGYPRRARQDLHAALARDVTHRGAWMLMPLTLLRAPEIDRIRTLRSAWRNRRAGGREV